MSFSPSKGVVLCFCFVLFYFDSKVELQRHRTELIQSVILFCYWHDIIICLDMTPIFLIFFIPHLQVCLMCPSNLLFIDFRSIKICSIVSAFKMYINGSYCFSLQFAFFTQHYVSEIHLHLYIERAGSSV